MYGVMGKTLWWLFLNICFGSTIIYNSQSYICYYVLSWYSIFYFFFYFINTNIIIFTSDEKNCLRTGGAIFAHSTGALTLLRGLELGYCRKDMKLNLIDAPLKGITLAELLHRRDDVWCTREQKNDQYFDDFFNDVIQAEPKVS